jgi:hypothetical protein
MLFSLVSLVISDISAIRASKLFQRVVQFCPRVDPVCCLRHILIFYSFSLESAATLVKLESKLPFDPSVRFYALILEAIYSAMLFSVGISVASCPVLIYVLCGLYNVPQ